MVMTMLPLRRLVVGVVFGAVVAGGAMTELPAQAAVPQLPVGRVVAAATPVASTAIPGARTVSLVIKGSVGKCKRVKKKVLAPSDRNQYCTFRMTLMGHAFPPPKPTGYLQRVAAQVSRGMVVSYQGKLYKVAWKKSYKKGHLPHAVLVKSGSSRYLVTCDTNSGYRNHHSIKNLVVKFVRA